MEKHKMIKNVFFCIIFFTVTIVNSQKLTFRIDNAPDNNKIFITKINDVVLKSVFEKESKFVVDYLGFDEGYYMLKVAENSVVLYLKPTDDLIVSFDHEDFYKSLNFSGEGAYVNTSLLNKKTPFLTKKGTLKKYYKNEFYEGDENEFLERLDKVYKENYGALFASKLSENFVEEEMKNLQYGYSLDLLRYQDGKKEYKFKDSLAPSNNFLEPLNHIHFQNNQLYKKYNSYKDLAILKWKKDIQNIPEHALKQELFSDIRIEELQEGILESLYEDMHKNFPERTRDYYKFIKRNTTNNKLLIKAKEKYAVIRQVEATKNLSRFNFLNSDGENEQLARFKGEFIFLNIWTTWCKACLNDFRNINDLEDQFQDENITFISVSLDKEEEYNLWENMLEEHGLKGKQWFLDDSKSKFIEAYEVARIPSFVLISPKGIPLEIEISKLTSKKTQKEILTLLKE